METIFSDGKSLKIERKLKITVFLPQLCHFCDKEITKFGKESGSLVFHSLDGDHENWEPTNKVSAHYGCHQSFHEKGRQKPWMRGDGNPMKRPEVRAKIMGDMNPMRRPEVVAKIIGEKNPMKRPEQRKRQSERMMDDKNPMRNPEVPKKIWKTRRERYGPSGAKTPTEKARKTWKTRRELYGPTGRKSK